MCNAGILIYILYMQYSYQYIKTIHAVMEREYNNIKILNNFSQRKRNMYNIVHCTKYNNVNYI